MAFLLARKLEMSQRFEGDRAVPVTVLEALPCTVTQVRTPEKDGYVAVQVGAGTRRRLSQALRGHFGGRGAFRWVREFRAAAPGEKLEAVDGEALVVGDVVDASVFKPGDAVQVTAVSKGKGFQGVVKRHRFHGQDATHGNKDQERMPGSIGAGGVQRVFKGRRMAGRMGGDRVTVSGLKIIAVDPSVQRVEISGAVPGARGTIVSIRSDRGSWT